jgi:hypothetical protein
MVDPYNSIGDITMPTRQNVLLPIQTLSIAEGSIGPDSRPVSEKLRATDINLYANTVVECYVVVDAEQHANPNLVGGQKLIVRKCVDGRPDEAGEFDIDPSAAGGTTSAVIGDALGPQAHRFGGANAATHALEIFTALDEAGYSIGGHDDNHAALPDASGCGAEDRLYEILDFIRQNGSTKIKPFLERIGVQVASSNVKEIKDIDTFITDRADALIKQKYVVPGGELRAAMVRVAGEKSIRRLANKHLEVALAINTEAGTTLDRNLLADRFAAQLALNDSDADPKQFQVFNVDVWALRNMADALAASPEQADLMFFGMLYYNVATAAVLADSSVPVLVH